MMHAEPQTDSPLFGLFEIDDEGIIRYYQPPADKLEADGELRPSLS
jgi:hypothetical protein